MLEAFENDTKSVKVHHWSWRRVYGTWTIRPMVLRK